MLFYILGKIKEPLYSFLVQIMNKIMLLHSPEKVESFGNLNPDKTFYVITNLAGGLASQYDAAIGYIDRAIKKGYIPIIDLRNTCNDCLKDIHQEEENPWEYYFEQPLVNEQQKKYSLDEVYRSANVIRCSSLHTIYKRVDKKNINKRYLLSNHVPIKREQLIYMNDKFAELFSTNEECYIGAYYRGTDYKKVGNWCPVGHAKVPQIEVFCETLQKDIDKWGCENIFFMTEEQEALDYVIKRFPNVKYVKKERFCNFKYGKTIAEQVPRNLSRYENNLLYLTDIYILSKGKYLVGTVNSGLLMAMNWNNNMYEDYHILDYGITK